MSLHQTTYSGQAKEVLQSDQARSNLGKARLGGAGGGQASTRLPASRQSAPGLGSGVGGIAPDDTRLGMLQSLGASGMIPGFPGELLASGTTGRWEDRLTRDNPLLVGDPLGARNYSGALEAAFSSDNIIRSLLLGNTGVGQAINPYYQTYIGLESIF